MLSSGFCTECASARFHLLHISWCSEFSVNTMCINSCKLSGKYTVATLIGLPKMVIYRLCRVLGGYYLDCNFLNLYLF